MKMMKAIFVLIFGGALAFGAANSLTVTVPGEGNTTIAISAEAVASIGAAIQATVAPGVTSTTLALATTAISTTLTVASTTNVTPGMGVLLGGEVSLITAVPSSTTLTVVRAQAGTTAVASLSAALVTYLRSGNYGWFVKRLIADWAVDHLAAYPGPALLAAEAQIATQQAAILAAIAASIQ
jgi:hypothetical protein